MIARIISGGQTGVDRAALDAAMQLGIATGGWCPKGRRAEDGRIPDRYQLVETPSADYPQRTEWNVRDADGTLILAPNVSLSGGTARTERELLKQGKQYRVIALDALPDSMPGMFHHAMNIWLTRFRISTLNIAGPRESRCPGIQAATTAFLMEVLRPFAIQR